MREVLSLTLNILSSVTLLMSESTNWWCNRWKWNKLDDGYKIFSIKKGPLDECFSNIFYHDPQLIYFICVITTHIHRIKTFHTKVLYLLCVMNSGIFYYILLYSFILKNNYCDSLHWFYIMLMYKNLKSEKWFLRSEDIKLILKGILKNMHGKE